MDRIVGDGDLGTSMKRAAAAVKDAVATYPLDDIAETSRALGHTLRHELGGSSGPLYGVLFLRAGNVMDNSGRAGTAEVDRSTRGRLPRYQRAGRARNLAIVQ